MDSSSSCGLMMLFALWNHYCSGWRQVANVQPLLECAVAMSSLRGCQSVRAVLDQEVLPARGESKSGFAVQSRCHSSRKHLRKLCKQFQQSLARIVQLPTLPIKCTQKREVLKLVRHVHFFSFFDSTVSNWSSLLDSIVSAVHVPWYTG